MSNSAYDFSTKARITRVMEGQLRKLESNFEWNAFKPVVKQLREIKKEKGEVAYKEALEEAATMMGFTEREIDILSESILIHEDFSAQARGVAEKLDHKYLNILK